MLMRMGCKMPKGSRGVPESMLGHDIAIPAPLRLIMAVALIAIPCELYSQSQAGKDRQLDQIEALCDTYLETADTNYWKKGETKVEQDSSKEQFEEAFKKCDTYLEIALKNYPEALYELFKLKSRLPRTMELPPTNYYGYRSLVDFVKAIKPYEKPLEAQKKRGDKADHASTLQKMGLAAVKYEQYAQASNFLRRSLEISNSIGNIQGQAQALNNLGTSYFGSGDITLALECLEQATKKSQEVGNKKLEATALNNIAQIHVSTREYEKGLKVYEKAVKICQSIAYNEGEWLNLAGMHDVYNGLSEKFPNNPEYESTKEKLQANCEKLFPSNFKDEDWCVIMGEVVYTSIGDYFERNSNRNPAGAP